MRITKDTTLAEILKDQKKEKILVKYHLPCLGCPMARFELDNLKIGDVCELYHIDLKSILEELNR